MNIPADYHQKNILTHNEQYLLGLLGRLHDSDASALPEAAQLVAMARDIKFRRYPLEFAAPYYWGRAFVDFKDKHGIDEVIFCGDLGRVYHASWDIKEECEHLQIRSQVHYEWRIHVAMYQDIEGVSGLTDTADLGSGNLCINIDKAFSSEFSIAPIDCLCRYDEVMV